METLTSKTVGQLIDKNACEIPDRKAVIYVEENISYTWTQLNKICGKTAKGLMALGVQRGNHAVHL